MSRRRDSATPLNASEVVVARAMRLIYAHIGICQAFFELSAGLFSAARGGRLHPFMRDTIRLHGNIRRPSRVSASESECSRRKYHPQTKGRGKSSSRTPLGSQSGRAFRLTPGCSLVLFVQEGFEAGVAGATDGEPHAVRKDGHLTVFAIRLDARDALEVHEVGAVDAHEESRVERQLET